MRVQLNWENQSEGRTLAMNCQWQRALCWSPFAESHLCPSTILRLVRPLKLGLSPKKAWSAWTTQTDLFSFGFPIHVLAAFGDSLRSARVPAASVEAASGAKKKQAMVAYSTVAVAHKTSADSGPTPWATYLPLVEHMHDVVYCVLVNLPST